ncbi:MAG: hypothetical protein ABUT20_06970 [Bacteroidota bacterium]
MEVHAHSHTARKKWTHYLWEFLMLFLAVFCGFLAEYQLEHKIEKERGRQYILSFYQDLKKDTAAFSLIIKSYEQKLNDLEDRKSCYKALKKNIQDEACLIGLVANSEKFTDLVYTEGTLQQLKNAGGLRLLNKNDADSILEYDNLLRTYIKHESTGFQDVQNSIRTVLQSIVNYDYIIDTANNSPAAFLYTKNPELINRYFNLLESYVIRCKWNLEDMEQIKIKATNLIGYFKRKYDLK